eukprot:gene2666-biopygen4381
MTKKESGSVGSGPATYGECAPAGLVEDIDAFAAVSGGVPMTELLPWELEEDVDDARVLSRCVCNAVRFLTPASDGFDEAGDRHKLEEMLIRHLDANRVVNNMVVVLQKTA